MLGDLQSHEPDARARTLDEHALAGAQTAVGDERVMHGLERNGQRRRLREGHVVGRDRRDAAPIGHRIFGIGAAARAHDAVAGLEAAHLAADFSDLARPFETGDRAGTAEIAVTVAGRHEQIGAIEAAGADADQDLVGLRPRLRHVADFEALLAQYGGLHGSPPELSLAAARRSSRGWYGVEGDGDARLRRRERYGAMIEIGGEEQHQPLARLDGARLGLGRAGKARGMAAQFEPPGLALTGGADRSGNLRVIDA